ncbi:hypothetical protein NIES3585_21430 [Nodularia sp. NIES-3585]|nr:hypothetical protein NIES3585_21430 [Nodularia sp. NIES-3585]
MRQLQKFSVNLFCLRTKAVGKMFEYRCICPLQKFSVNLFCLRTKAVGKMFEYRCICPRICKADFWVNNAYVAVKISLELGRVVSANSGAKITGCTGGA